MDMFACAPAVRRIETGRRFGMGSMATTTSPARALCSAACADVRAAAPVPSEPLPQPDAANAADNASAADRSTAVYFLRIVRLPLSLSSMVRPHRFFTDFPVWNARLLRRRSRVFIFRFTCTMPDLSAVFTRLHRTWSPPFHCRVSGNISGRGGPARRWSSSPAGYLPRSGRSGPHGRVR